MHAWVNGTSNVGYEHYADHFFLLLSSVMCISFFFSFEWCYARHFSMWAVKCHLGDLKKKSRPAGGKTAPGHHSHLGHLSS